MAIRLPSSLVGAFIDKEDSIFNYKADELLLKRETVEVNDEEPVVTHYRSSYSRHSSSRHSAYKSSRNRRERKKKENKEESKSITIKDGDTLSEIAVRHNTTVEKLRKLNKMSGSNIRAGKKIKVK